MRRRYQIDQQRAVQQFRQLAREESPSIPFENQKSPPEGQSERLKTKRLQQVNGYLCLGCSSRGLSRSY